MIKKYVIKIFKNIKFIISRIINKMEQNDITMSQAVYKETGRYLIYTVVNNNMLEIKELLELVYNQLQSDKTFLNFGEKKVILINAETPNLNGLPCVHPNVFITNNTTFEDYYSKIRYYIDSEWLDTNVGYGIDVIKILHIKIWNLDLFKNSNITKNSLHLISFK